MKLIDADLLLRILEIDGRMSAEKAERYDYSNDELRKIISLAAFQHGKDMVEVVRCEDCKHRVVDEILLSFTSVPESAWVCDIGTTACLTGFYCKRGERKDGQQ